jgi:hypothetical protein
MLKRVRLFCGGGTVAGAGFELFCISMVVGTEFLLKNDIEILVNSKELGYNYIFLYYLQSTITIYYE